MLQKIAINKDFTILPFCKIDTIDILKQNSIETYDYLHTSFKFS